MRQYNERVVLEVLRTHGHLPKAELARLTGLSAQAIGQITSRLDTEHLLVHQAPVRGRVGQPSVPIGLNPDGAFAVGIQIGRRGAQWLLVDMLGRVRQRLTLGYPSPQADTLMPAIGSHLRQLLDGLGALAARVVGVGVAAPYELGAWQQLMDLSEEQAQAWRETDLQAGVQAMTDLPVTVARDTVAACMAELLQGHGRTRRDFLYLFMDTLVGGGLVIDSRLYWGRHGNAGAVASLPTALATKLMPQAVPPQLLGVASMRQLEQRFRVNGLDPAAAYDQRACQPPWQGETMAWLDQAALALAQCIVAATAFLDIDAVVLDGAISPDLLELLMQRTRLALRAYSWEGLMAQPVLELGVVGADARALGAGLLPLHDSFSPDPALFLKS